MASLAEILKANPDKIKFDRGKPPVIGEVPTHTYGLLLDVHHLELLDGPENVLDDMVPDAEPILSREEELRRELQGVSDKYGVPTTAIVETEDKTVIFTREAPHVTAASKPISPENKPKTRHDMSPNQKNHADNIAMFSGRRGKTIFEKGVAVQRKKH